MSVPITMPKLSQTTDTVRLIRWLVREGERVERGQALCEVENDKTTMPVESFASGTVLGLIGEPDSEIAAGTVIAVLGEPGEKAAVRAAPAGPAAGAPPAPAAEPAGSPPTPPAPPPPRTTEAHPESGDRGGQAASSPPAANRGADSPAASSPPAANRGADSPAASSPPATRLVQNLARKRGVDLARVRGTGPRGLITRADLEAYLAGAAGAAAPAAAPGTPAAPGAPGRPPAPAGLSGRQLAIGRALQAAKARIPHYYLKATLFCERLAAWRENNRRLDGGRVSIDALLAAAAARALRRHPAVNAAFRDDRLEVASAVHIGVAVAAGAELYVPVIRDADRRDAREIDRELALLAARARAGRLEPAEERGGTLTLTNLGMYPIDEFGAIINPPQVAILAFGRIGRRLDIDESGAMRVREACTVTGSFDHRAVNGAQGAAFLAELKRIIEEEL